MAKLTVKAIGEDGLASPGNSSILHIVVSVTDANGVGVAGLAIANFALGSEIVGAGGSTSHIDTVSNGKLTGTYLLKALPLAGQTWKAGVYIFSVNVTSGANHGQTLFSFLMD